MTPVDPLSGKREQLNRGEMVGLIWPDDGGSCSVEVGQLFVLRSCGIEITKIQRFKQKGKRLWRAEYKRILKTDKPVFLDRRRGTTEHLDRALSAHDDPNAATLDRISPEEASEAYKALGAAPEPEAVPDHEIANYTASLEARQRYDRLQAELHAVETAMPIEVRLARIREQARERHIDISSEERVIERRLEAMERKVLEKAA